MKIIGYEKNPDWPKLGPSMLIAAAMVVGIRTARWEAVCPDQLVADVDPELDKEVAFAVRVANRVLNEMLRKHSDLFPQKIETIEEMEDESPK